jgi:hypothetical protein
VRRCMWSLWAFDPYSLLGLRRLFGLYSLYSFYNLDFLAAAFYSVVLELAFVKQ